MRRTVFMVSLLLVLALTAALVSPPAAGADAHAVRPENRPNALDGVENGRLPDAALVVVAPGCRVDREAAPSLRLLLDLAAGSGVELGIRSCYRPIVDQVRVGQQWTARGNSACAAPVQRTDGGRPVGTSMHGWGRAVDLSDGSRPMTFTSPGHRFLRREAGRAGWNHPGWARPGGSACPEPWHWEWVGDGGRLGARPVPADVVAVIASGQGPGHAVVTGLGEVRHRGSIDHGSAADIPIAWLVIGATGTPSGGGYWLVAGDGGVFSFGDARFHGSTGALRLNRPVVDMAATPSGGGYWLVAGDGGVFSFGDARFHGSTGALRLNRPIVDMAATPSGGGYWLVAGDGGVFSFGDAAFHGSLGGRRLDQPAMALTATATGGGYWLVTADGAVSAFGDAVDHGSPPSRAHGAPVVGIERTPTGGGYWVVAADGEVWSFGDAAAGPAR